MMELFFLQRSMADLFNRYIYEIGARWLVNQKS